MAELNVPKDNKTVGDKYQIEWIGADDGRIHAVEVQPDKFGGSYMRIKPPGRRSYWVSLVHLFDELYPNGLGEWTKDAPDLPMHLTETKLTIWASLLVLATLRRALVAILRM